MLIGGIPGLREASSRSLVIKIGENRSYENVGNSVIEGGGRFLSEFREIVTNVVTRMWAIPSLRSVGGGCLSESR